MAKVFCLTREGQLLPPAVQATVLAKYSRSPLSASEIVASLSAEEADKFQEKWVVGYGHNSVAELAVVPVCLEGISIVASKYVESWKRPGYSEKSTRYQRFSAKSFVTPPGAPDSMAEFVASLYTTYDALQDRMLKRAAELFGQDPTNPEVLTSGPVKARAFDNLRYLLPAGTGTNVAVVANMRDHRDMVRGLRGHSNPEMRELGGQLHDALGEICPALIKHMEPDEFRLPVRSVGDAGDFDPEDPSWFVRIHRPHLMPGPELEQRAFESLVADRHGMEWGAFCKFMDGRPVHAEVPDVFSSVKIAFDILMDYGAYRDLQRHRRCDQFSEVLTTDYGYVVPDDILGSDMEAEYRAAMELVRDVYRDERVVHDVDLMQYVTPLGYLHRSCFQMDLRELYYVVELRTKPHGHISYRRVAYKMFKLAAARLPGLMRWCRAHSPDQIGEHH